jgi:hypothetical protein
MHAVRTRLHPVRSRSAADPVAAPAQGAGPIAQLAPLAAVLLFLAAIVSAFWYLRLEETRREQEAVKRDVEYSQQRLRLRLLERQEQLMRLARELADREMTALQFDARAEAMVAQYPELRAVSWIDGQRRLRTTQAAPSVSSRPDWLAGDRLKPGDASDGYELAQDLRQAVYSQPLAAEGSEAVLYLHVPITPRAQFAGVVLAEYSVDGLLRHGVPAEVLAKYAVSLLDAKGQLLAGQTIPDRTGVSEYLPWTDQVNAFDSPVSPVGNGLVLRAQAWRTSQGVVGGTLFWLVAVLATMTAWMLIANWRQSQRRQQAQQALLAETKLSPRHGKLHAHRHARARPAGPHHLRQPGLLPDDRLERGRADRPVRTLQLLAGRPTARNCRRAAKTS